MKTLIKILFLITVVAFLTGCSTIWQNMKDNYEHQFIDSREDDLDGEYCADKRLINDSAMYLIELTYKFKGKTITKGDVLCDTLTIVLNIDREELVDSLLIEVNCKWWRAKAYHMMFITVENWTYHIEFKAGERGEICFYERIRIPRRGNFLVRAGVRSIWD